MIFNKIADVLNKKASSVEEEIKFKEFSAESEEMLSPAAKESASEPASTTLSATATEKEGNIELKLAHPDSFEDVSTIADYLLEGCTVLLNLEAVNKSEVLRMLDFLNGVTYTTGYKCINRPPRIRRP
jgi:FtsZ-interacting cell division protein YlmF